MHRAINNDRLLLDIYRSSRCLRLDSKTSSLCNSEDILHSTLLSISQILQRLLDTFKSIRLDFKRMALEFPCLHRPFEPATGHESQIAGIRSVSSILLVVNNTHRSEGLFHGSDVKIARQNEVDRPVRGKNLSEHLSDLEARYHDPARASLRRISSRKVIVGLWLVPINYP